MSVTDADRANALRLLVDYGLNQRQDAIAAALAEEREKARAELLAQYTRALTPPTEVTE